MKLTGKEYKKAISLISKTQLENLEPLKENGKYVISEGLMELTIEAIYAKGVSDGFIEGIK